MNRRRVFVCAFLVLLSTGCSGILVGNFKKASMVAQRNPDPMLLKYGAPSNLLLFESLAANFSDNRDLMALIAQTYCSYAMGFVQDEDPERAMVLFGRGRDFGLRSLLLISPFKSAVQAAAGKKPADLNEAITQAADHLEVGLDAIKDKKYVEFPFWTGQCWGGWLNLAKKDPLALFDIPKVKALMQKVVDLDDTFFFGGAHLFFALYYAGLPPIAGGGLDKSQLEFDKVDAINKDRLLLPKLFYAEQFIAIRKAEGDEEKFVEILQGILDAPVGQPPELTAANEIAKLKAKRLLARKDEFF